MYGTIEQLVDETIQGWGDYESIRLTAENGISEADLRDIDEEAPARGLDPEAVKAALMAECRRRVDSDDADETMNHTLYGYYPGATSWSVQGDIGSPEEYARELAESAGCSYYSVDGVVYGPFDDPNSPDSTEA